MRWLAGQRFRSNASTSSGEKQRREERDGTGAQKPIQHP
jgi:hypothetical protein